MRGKGSCVAIAGAMASLLALAAAPNAAADPQDITSFVDCLKGITTTPQTVVDAVQCVPSTGCAVTVTTSEESAQPGCTLSDGTRLPRVIFSCTGHGGSTTLRFRPSFSLCVMGGVINHIEVGEDVSSRHVQKMGDIDTTVGFQNLTYTGVGAAAVFDTKVPSNNKGCFDCHDRMGSVASGTDFINLFAAVPPELREGTIYTNDSSVTPPATQVPLADICTGISNSPQLTRTPARKALALALCDALEPKTH